VLSILRDIFRVNTSVTAKPSAIRNVHVVWSMRSIDLYDGFEDSFRAIASTPLADRRTLSIGIYVSQGKCVPANVEDHPHVSFFGERANLGRIMDSVVSTEESTLVFACGPEGMVSNAWDLCQTRTQMQYRVDFHHETFEF